MGRVAGSFDVMSGAVELRLHDKNELLTRALAMLRAELASYIESVCHYNAVGEDFEPIAESVDDEDIDSHAPLFALILDIEDHFCGMVCGVGPDWLDAIIARARLRQGRAS